MNLLLRHLLILSVLLWSFSPAASAATTATLTVGGSSGPISATTGTAVVFDLNVSCGGASSNDLIYVPGSAQPKDNEGKSEIAWAIQNQSAATIRIDSFGVSWNCLNDPGNVCSAWKFDYVKFDVNDENKIYENMAPVDISNSFPVTGFDTNVGDQSPYQNRYIDIAAGQTISINEMEFVDFWGEKYKYIPSGTSVEFTVTWRDVNGNSYPQVFTVTW